MEGKVNKLIQRLQEVEEILGDPDIFNDQKRYREVSTEHKYLCNVRSAWEELQRLRQEAKDNREMFESESDPEFLEVLKEDLNRVEEKLPEAEKKLSSLLVPPDPADHRNAIVELRAGTGGDEAALFVGDCVRMYKFYAGRMGWSVESLSASESDAGGYKDYVMVLSGENVHRFMQYEGGTHRVQRVPETETQGRVHTSAITVAVLQEPDESEEIQLDEKDLRIDTYRASGAGGQHVNTTDSAVRITHTPTGMVAWCQEEKSQHKNKAKALRLLQAKVRDVEEQKKQAEIASSRATQVGSGDRSERIRTYNFPQNRITDHRINMTRYSLDKAMVGELEEFSEALVAHYYQKKLDEAGK
ncbi:MAG: peptide chain release factor 1 [Waddliaceae bacterium]|nr:peptide chain release factor 1 [Waddliaceae bacterium]